MNEESNIRIIIYSENVLYKSDKYYLQEVIIH